MIKDVPVCAVVLLVAATSPSAPAEDFHVVLTETRTNLWVEGFAVDHTQVETGSDAEWSVKKHTLHGGKQEGVDVVEIDNGRLRFTVIPTRGMNVHEVHCGDVRLGWDSPVHEVVHPAFINAADRSGLGWLEGFNEWMARCGYEFAGHPGEDGEQMLTLHGKASNTPASRVEVAVEGNRIHVRGRVEERLFKFAALEMVTDISTEIGSAALRFDDALTNHGANEQEYEIIYHSNYGPPLLEAGAKFVGPVKALRPFDERAAAELKTQDYAVYPGPTKNYGETVYCMEMHADRDGRTTVMLQNAAADRGVAMRYGVESLPFFTLWKNTDVGEKGYVTGLEPGTGFPYNRSVERKRGRLATLQPSETRTFRIDVEVLTDAEAVVKSAAEIAAIQGGREPTVSEDPEP